VVPRDEEAEYAELMALSVLGSTACALLTTAPTATYAERRDDIGQAGGWNRQSELLATNSLIARLEANALEGSGVGTHEVPNEVPHGSL